MRNSRTAHHVDAAAETRSCNCWHNCYRSPVYHWHRLQLPWPWNGLCPCQCAMLHMRVACPLAVGGVIAGTQYVVSHIMHVNLGVKSVGLGCCSRALPPGVAFWCSGGGCGVRQWQVPQGTSTASRAGTGGLRPQPWAGSCHLQPASHARCRCLHTMQFQRP